MSFTVLRLLVMAAVLGGIGSWPALLVSSDGSAACGRATCRSCSDDKQVAARDEACPGGDEECPIAGIKAVAAAASQKPCAASTDRISRSVGAVDGATHTTGTAHCTRRADGSDVCFPLSTIGSAADFEPVLLPPAISDAKSDAGTVGEVLIEGFPVSYPPPILTSAACRSDAKGTSQACTAGEVVSTAACPKSSACCEANGKDCCADQVVCPSGERETALEDTVENPVVQTIDELIEEVGDSVIDGTVFGGDQGPAERAARTVLRRAALLRQLEAGECAGASHRRTDALPAELIPAPHGHRRHAHEGDAPHPPDHVVATLREVGQRLDELAHQLESAELYGSADELRHTADGLRHQAREIASHFRPRPGHGHFPELDDRGRPRPVQAELDGLAEEVRELREALWQWRMESAR